MKICLIQFLTLMQQFSEYTKDESAVTNLEAKAAALIADPRKSTTHADERQPSPTRSYLTISQVGLFLLFENDRCADQSRLQMRSKLLNKSTRQPVLLISPACSAGCNRFSSRSTFSRLFYRCIGFFLPSSLLHYFITLCVYILSSIYSPLSI